jgi:hypothetical protein
MGFYGTTAQGSDSDGNGELGVPSVTLYDTDGPGESSGVWEEAVRDMAAQHGIDLGTHRSRAVLHELGHQFGLHTDRQHNGDDYVDTVMWGPVVDPVHNDDRPESWIDAMRNHFEPIDIDTIRNQARNDPRFPSRRPRKGHNMNQALLAALAVVSLTSVAHAADTPPMSAGSVARLYTHDALGRLRTPEELREQGPRLWGLGPTRKLTVAV